MTKDAWRLEDPSGASWNLPEHGKVVLGCSPERAGIVVDDPGVDPAHCAIGRSRDGTFAVKDLGSRSGTFVDDKRVNAARLPPGTKLRLGGRTLFVLGPGQSAPKAKRGASKASTPPDRIGGFRIEGRLGKGGMGEVFLALQESLHRPVALKVLSRELGADAEFVRRFQAEARAAAALSHPNVVVVFDVGEADGRHFLAMEYMSGGNLEERIEKQGRLPWREVLDILHDAASGLAFAEEQGILHRDIKPANLMVSSSGVVKIADLGLATQMTEQEDGGKTYGTPHFISPEQARGEALDQRSDLYSLGATAYRLLTGRTPFGGRSAREIILARYSTDPLPPRDLVPTIPEPISDLLLRLLSRDPDGRPNSAEDLLRELESLGPGGASAPSKSSRRLLPLLLLALVFAAGGGWWFLTGSDRMNAASASTGTGPSNAATVGGFPEDDAAFFGTGADGADPGKRSADEEQVLRQREREAELAIEAIPSGYSTEDRIGSLEDIVRRFGGTEVADRANTELDRLRSGITARGAAAERRATEMEETLRRIVESSGWRGGDPDSTAPISLGPVVESIRSYQVGTTLVTDPEFLARRARRIDQIVSDTDEAAQGVWERAVARIAEGRFDEARPLLGRLAAGFDLGPPKRIDPRGYAKLRDLTSEATRRLSGLEEERVTYLRNLLHSDRAELAGQLGPASAFPEELQNLQIQDALDRLTRGPTPRTELGRERRRRVLDRLSHASEALALLMDTFTAGQWRRRTVAVPGPRRATTREVVGVRKDGLLLAADGTAEFLPFGRFTQDPKTLATLFRNRFTRALSPSERAGITRLFTLAASARVLAIVTPFLGSGRASAGSGLFRPTDVEAIEEAFVAADTWLESLPPTEDIEREAAAELARERAAAALLAEALTAAEEESWTQAAANLQVLLSTETESWLVLARSDGTGLEAPSGNDATDNN